MKAGSWKVLRPRISSEHPTKYRVARVMYDDGGPSHVEEAEFADTLIEAEVIAARRNKAEVLGTVTQ
jgi:hypothetical protein